MSSSNPRPVFRGDDMNISRPRAVVIGDRNKVSGDGSIVKGNRNTVVGAGSTVAGDSNFVWADMSAVVGVNNTVNGSRAVVKGHNNHISGKNLKYILATDTFDYEFTDEECQRALSHSEWAAEVIAKSGIVKEGRPMDVVEITFARFREDDTITQPGGPLGPSTIAQTDINDVKDLVYGLENRTEGDPACIICINNPPDVIAMPCGHMHFCGPCVVGLCSQNGLSSERSGMVKCPVCAADVWKFGRVYQ